MCQHVVFCCVRFFFVVVHTCSVIVAAWNKAEYLMLSWSALGLNIKPVYIELARCPFLHCISTQTTISDWSDYKISMLSIHAFVFLLCFFTLFCFISALWTSAPLYNSITWHADTNNAQFFFPICSFHYTFCPICLPALIIFCTKQSEIHFSRLHKLALLYQKCLVFFLPSLMKWLLDRVQCCILLL